MVQVRISPHLCSALGPPSMSYKAICRLLLLELGLEVPRQSQTVTQSWLLLVLGLWLNAVNCCLFEKQLL